MRSNLISSVAWRSLRVSARAIFVTNFNRTRSPATIEHRHLAHRRTWTDGGDASLALLGERHTDADFTGQDEEQAVGRLTFATQHRAGLILTTFE